MQIKKIEGKKELKIQLLRSTYDTGIKRGKQVSLGVFPHNKRLSAEEMDQIGLTDTERQELGQYFDALEAQRAEWNDRYEASKCHENLQRVCEVLKKGTEMSQEKLAELQRDVEELKVLLHRRGMKKKMVVSKKEDATAQASAKKMTAATT